MTDFKQTEKKREEPTTAEKDELPSLVVGSGTKKEDQNVVTDAPENANAVIDLSISRHLDPVPLEVRQLVRRQANKFIRKQRVVESTINKDALKRRQDDLNMRRNFDLNTVREIMLHPYYVRMMRIITEEMIEEGLWSRYKPNKFIRDTETTRRRMQNAVPVHVMEYAIKYTKKPWRYPGKNKIKTKFFEKVDWVDDPFLVLEEKTEQDFKKKSIKA